MALLTTEEQVNILMQEVARLNNENVKLIESNQAILIQLMNLVDATKTGFLNLNEQITNVKIAIKNKDRRFNP